jgi:hypothetical protein
MVQPRMVGGLVVLGTVFQRPEVFLALAAVMAWATRVPSQNLFDAIYNYTAAYPRGLPPLRVAPAPRRFSQGFAAAMSLAMGLARLTGATSMAWILEGAALISIASVLVRRFCVPAHLYYVRRRTLSWTLGVPVWVCGSAPSCRRLRVTRVRCEAEVGVSMLPSRIPSAIRRVDHVGDLTRPGGRARLKRSAE